MDIEYDFIQTINSTQLIDEINISGLPTPDYITTTGTCVQVFYANSLTNDQQTTLSTVVTNHIANPNYMTLVQQIQVNTLIAYLNNTNTTISNTARSVIIKNLAVNIPLATLTVINSQIYAIVGQ